MKMIRITAYRKGIERQFCSIVSASMETGCSVRTVNRLCETGKRSESGWLFRRGLPPAAERAALRRMSRSSSCALRTRAMRIVCYEEDGYTIECSSIKQACEDYGISRDKLVGLLISGRSWRGCSYDYGLDVSRDRIKELESGYRQRMRRSKKR